MYMYSKKYNKKQISWIKFYFFYTVHSRSN